MTEFNFVFLVGKKVVLELENMKSYQGKIKQVFGDRIILEDDLNTHVFKKDKIEHVLISKENNKTVQTNHRFVKTTK